MSPAVDERGVRIPFRLILAFWVTLGLLDGLQSYLMRLSFGETLSPSIILFPQHAYLVLAVLTPGIIWLVNRYPLDRTTLRRNLPIHIIASLLFTLFVLLGSANFLAIIRRAPPVWLKFSWAVDILRYWAVVGVVQAVRLGARARVRETEAEALRAEAASLRASLSEARLQALTEQLRPHFLFNTLNVISGHVLRRDPDSAAAMITALGDLLRRSLNRQAVVATVEEELDFLQRYLEIERNRMGERLEVRIDCDAAARDALIPTFLLQTLVENAIRHGVARKPGRGTVAVSIRNTGSDVRITVADDGPGFAESEDLVLGVGLTTTVERMAELYGGAASVDVTPGPEGGAIVTVLIPPEPPSAETEQTS